ncbi:MAG TPA: esterase [Terriglobia bacterium]|nr:esterase [Terriglobia bacterium]
MRLWMPACAVLLLTILSATPLVWAQNDHVTALRFEVTIPAATAPLTGHLVLVIAKKEKPEPRFQMNEGYTSAQGFGVDVENLPPGTPIVVDDSTLGYPRDHLSDLDPGEYVVQAVFNVYEQFHLGDGKTVWLPPDRGEGQHWNQKPGNPYDAPVKLRLDPASGATIRLKLDKTIPPVEDPAQMAAKDPGAKWLKYLRFKSAKLTEFWGRDTYLGAWILLPDGFDEHPDARYPLVVYQNHFTHRFSAPLAFRTTPPAPDLKGGALLRAQYSYKFFQDWTSGRLPRVILINVENANPYYDDSYVVDSANVGPYGAAITEELIPEIERRYRGIGKGWARATFGGSTGGWEALAQQVFYPDFYNGAYVACPDPVDFHAYQDIDLYDDKNAFLRQGDFGEIPIPADRKPDGSITADTGGSIRYELILGTHGRSGEQWNIWQAVFSPQGEDAYPKPIFDPITGVIDKSVVAYWHDHYDLTAILERDWPVLGPKVQGKLHLAVGDGDTYFLNNAVHLLQKQLEATRNPHSDATFQYGEGEPHCYTGGPGEYTMQQNNLTWAQRVLPKMAEHWLATAPAGADVKSWRY